MSDNRLQISENVVQNKILTIRNLQVVINKDLAELYQIQTKVLNQAVKRNAVRFPDLFRFQLSDFEKKELVTNCDRFQNLKHSNVNPYAFTEHGAAMLSAILKSDVAVDISIQIIKAFVNMRNFLSDNKYLFERLNRIEYKQLETDNKFDMIFNALNNKKNEMKEGIFFDGQVFDAYYFISKLIKSANISLILIDNYIDESVLEMLSKKK